MIYRDEIMATKMITITEMAKARARAGVKTNIMHLLPPLLDAPKNPTRTKTTKEEEEEEKKVRSLVILVRIWETGLVPAVKKLKIRPPVKMILTTMVQAVVPRTVEAEGVQPLMIHLRLWMHPCVESRMFAFGIIMILAERCGNVLCHALYCNPVCVNVVDLQRVLTNSFIYFIF